MSKFVVVLIAISIFGNILVSAGTPAAASASVTASAFSNATVKVFDVTNTTDKTSWVPSAIPYTGVVFGPGSDNTSVWSYGVTYTVGNVGTISGIVQRKISTSMLASGNDTTGTELSVVGSDSVSTTLAYASIRTPIFAVGNGYLAAATITVTGTAPTTQALVLLVWTSGTTSAASATIASGADTGISSTGTTQDYNINSVWYESGYFYVSYTSVTGSIVSSTNTYTEAAVLIQAVLAATPSTTLYKTPISVTTSTVTIASYSRTAGGTTLMPVAGPSNYTNSSQINVVYKSTTKTILIPVAAVAGTVGTAVTLTTDIAAGSATAGATWTPLGFFYSNVTYGVLLGATNASTTPITTTYGITVCFNGTSTCQDSGIIFPSISGAVSVAWGLPYNNTGYLIQAFYPAGTSPSTGCVEQFYYANGSPTSTSATTVGTVSGKFTPFRDSANSLWLGYAVQDTGNTAYVYSGYVGRLLYALFPTTATTYANATIVSVISIFAVIVSLFTL